MEYWTVWYPKGASTGLLVGRGLLDVTDDLLVHAVPPVLTVEVSTEEGERVAFGKNLEKTADSPMCHLRKEGDRIIREDIWPSAEHYGLPVLMPGGEAAILKSWWHADDKKEWRWQVELYNSVR